MALLKKFFMYVIFIIAMHGIAYAKNLQLQEREIQIGLLYNFLKYTSWPGNKMSDIITICIIGADPFSGELTHLSRRTVNRHNITVQKINNAGDAAGCHLAIVSSSNNLLWDELNSLAISNNILTVSTESGFSSRGGMVEFGRSGSRINVKLNINNVKQANLSIADRMLRLVTLVN